jgi:hypothetical protein
MADNNQNLNKIKKSLEEIKKNYADIGKENPFEGIEAASANSREVNKELKNSRNLLKEINEDADELTSSFKAILEEVSNTNKAYSSSNKSLNSLTSIASKLRDHQTGISRLSAKELSTLQSKSKSNSKSLEDNKKILEAKRQHTALLPKEAAMLVSINGLLDEQESSLNGLNDSLEEEAKNTKKIERSTGLMGATLKGISKIPLLGDAVDANDAVGAMEEHLHNSGTKIGALGVGLKNIGGQLGAGILNPANLLVGAFSFMVSTIKDLDAGAGNFAKTMNVTYGEALKTKGEMLQLAQSSGDAAINSKRLLESLSAVGESLGTNAKLNEGDLKTMTEMVRKSGLTHDEIMGIEKLSLVNGKTLKQNTKETLSGAKAYATKNKLVVNEKQVLKEVSKSSAAIQVSLGMSTKELARSVVQAKQYGLSMEQTEKMVGSLLKFEQSIENELAAELITGKSLNLEKARGLALNNDTAGAAAEIAKQVGSAAEFGKMNRIQQEAIAAAVGLGREELAQSLIDKEALASISAEEGETALQAYQRRIEAGETQAQIEADMGDKALSDMLAQQSAAEKFEDTMTELKEMVVSVLFPVFQQITETIRNNIPLIKTMLKFATAVAVAAGVYKATLIASNIAQGVSNMLKKKGAKDSKKELGAEAGIAGMKTFGAIPVVGIGLGIAAAIAAMYAMSSLGNDIMSTPGYGQRTLMGPEGAIQLNDKDTVIAGTNLFGNDVKSSPGESTEMANAGEMKVSGGNNMETTNTLLRQLITTVQAGGVINMDGEKVASVLSKIPTVQ